MSVPRHWKRADDWHGWDHLYWQMILDHWDYYGCSFEIDRTSLLISGLVSSHKIFKPWHSGSSVHLNFHSNVCWHLTYYDIHDYNFESFNNLMKWMHFSLFKHKNYLLWLGLGKDWKNTHIITAVQLRRWTKLYISPLWLTLSPTQSSTLWENLVFETIQPFMNQPFFF